MARHVLSVGRAAAGLIGLLMVGGMLVDRALAAEDRAAAGWEQIAPLLTEKATPEDLLRAVPKLTEDLVAANWVAFDTGFVGADARQLLNSLTLAHELRTLVAKIRNDQQAQLAALEQQDQQARDLFSRVEALNAVGGRGGDVATLHMVGCRRAMVAAELAAARGDKAGQTEALKRALAEAEQFYAAEKAQYDAGIRGLGSDGRTTASNYRFEAKTGLIALGTPDAAQAKQARIAAIEQYLADLDVQYKLADAQRAAGFAGETWRVHLAGCRLQSVAAQLARQRGDQARAAAALKQAVAEAEKCYAAVREMFAQGVIAGTSGPMLTAEKCRFDAQMALIGGTIADAENTRKARRAAQQAYLAALGKIAAEAERRFRGGIPGAQWRHVLDAACRCLLLRLEMAQEEGFGKGLPAAEDRS